MRRGFLDAVGVIVGENLVVKNHTNGLRLQQQFKHEQASSMFDENGYLTDEAIKKSILIPLGQFKNPKLIREISERQEMYQTGLNIDLQKRS